MKYSAKRIGLITLGWVVLLAGILMVPYPGPGWATVFAGLAILAREYTWAHNLLGYGKQKYKHWNDWLQRQSLYVRIFFFLLTTIIVIITLWLLGVYGLIADLLGVNVPYLHSPLPFL